MGLFGKKKVRFAQMGMLMAYQCPCNLSETGLDVMYPQRDEVVPGYTADMLTKCGKCGAIFLSFDQKDQGGIVGRGRTYEEERAQGLSMRHTLDD